MSLWAAENIEQAQAYAVQTLMERLRPSLAILGDPRRPSGTATLLDAQQNLFLAHRDAVQGDTVDARLVDGNLRLKVLWRDNRTSLVLLGPNNEKNLLRLDRPDVRVAENEPGPNTPIVVLLANGGLVGSFVGGKKVLLTGDRKQAVPASELRFETPPQLVAGALILTLDGRLIGTMGATVARANNSAAVTTGALADVREIVQGQSQNGRTGFAAPLIKGQVSIFGPQTLTVAYTPNLTAIRRTVNGFLSENHRPEYAGLGIQVQETVIGVVVARVVDDSPAAKAGVKVGDILLAMNDHAIVKQYDFVQSLWASHPGEGMSIRVRRDGADKNYSVMLARVKN